MALTFKPYRRWYTPTVCLLLGWVLLSGLYLAQRDALTTDEGIHVASGYLALTRRDFRFDPEHPFLFKALSAAPLLALDLKSPADDRELWDRAAPTFFDSWREARGWADQWYYLSGNPTDSMVFLARIPAVLLTVLLAWLVWWLGCRWFSRRIGLAALFFIAFNPTVLAHGHLANTDVPVTLALLAFLACLWRYLRVPSWRTAALVGLSFGIALGTKHSAASFLLVLLLAWWYQLAARRVLPMVPLRRSIGYLLLTCTVSILTIWTAYLWRSPLRLSDQPLQYPVTEINSALERHGTSLTAYARVSRFILPSDYQKGFLLVLGSSTYGRGSYLFNRHYSHGVWFYFPSIFLLKTQLVALLLLAGTLPLAWRRRRRLAAHPAAFLLGTAGLLYLGVSMVNQLNLGIRHLMPLMPILAFALAGALVWAAGTRRFPPWGRRGLVAVTLTAYAVPVLVQYPYLLSFRNSVVQPPTAAYRYYNDSNLEWGEQAREIAEIARYTFYTDQLYVNFPWSPYAIAHFGVRTVPFDAANLPTHGIVVVTGTQLSQDEYASFRSRTPAYVIGNHTYFYAL